MRDLMGMMKQAKELQERMQQMQAELETIEVDGAAGGGLVTARVTAKGECKAVRIDPSLVKPEEVEILEDLIVAALADARSKAERVMQDKMQALTGGLALPPGLKLF
ncbi:YbaB/EbfC family nucleoid-associated protein [Xanthobacter autotrophicus DSM 431]|uniref:YbaB/EbfC family nucleoid-associated protein n=1 Tax=Xanthobacter nonsaccharivorans TaxID=3119912 RepID=UPI00372866AD